MLKWEKILDKRGNLYYLCSVTKKQRAMKWIVEVKAKSENGKLITLISTFDKKYQCEAYVRGVRQIIEILDYVIKNNK